MDVFKVVNDEGSRISKYLLIDSVGNVNVSGKKISALDLKKFTLEVNKYVRGEKIDTIPGNNNISFLEILTPALNKESIYVRVKFLDDIKRENNLRNKTYYAWHTTSPKNTNGYILFNYLTESEVKILKKILE